MLTCFPSAVIANGAVRPGTSARPSGRGSVNLAFSDNGQILLDNPASMVWMNDGHGRQARGMFDIGGELLLSDLDYADGDNPFGATSSNNPLPVGSAAIMQRVHPDVMVGIGVFAPAGFSTKWRMDGPAAIPGGQVYQALGGLVRAFPAGN
ncbi:MAG: hypothetical protein AAFP69_10790, partial [Planctomycetota bacterium]